MHTRVLLFAALLLLGAVSTAGEYPTAADAGANNDGPPGAVWIVDPSAPGADAPPVGRSLFDYLFTAEREGESRYDVPFPFEALVARIESTLAPEPMGAVKQVAIPLGRSLHRHAAAPDFFRYPRIVAAVDGQPAEGLGDHAGLVLKNRLFLGYQQKANVIEVISYNPEAGRFEFQVVRDYAAGRQPRVSYASRVLCMSCHQNGGAIFPSARWRETEANEEIAALIERARPGFLSQPNGGRRFDVPWAIDYATDQANYYSSYQRPQQTDARLACVRHTFEFVELEDTEVCLPLEILGRLVRRMLRANSAPVQAFALSAARPTGSPPNSRIASIRQGHK